ncbi:hypothetical protein ACO1O0_001305 [Amphichorda felina]
MGSAKNRPSSLATVCMDKDLVEVEQLSSSSDPPHKAQSEERRAQVRRAQIRHRERKTNYQRQLEFDAAKYRDLVARTEAETTALRHENEALRAALINSGIDISQLTPRHGPSTAAQSDTGTSLSPSLEPDIQTGQDTPATTPELFGGIDINDLTVTLAVDDTLGGPAFHINSSSSGASFYTPVSPGHTDDGWCVLSRAQEDAAINFILALEHVCWDHFCVGDFPHQHPHHYHQETPEDTDTEDPNHGHYLMATTYCMAHAPASFYDDRRDLQPAAPKPKSPTAAPAPPSFQWQSPGITLASLRSLASSVNPGDSELTPVQAWFELAERYPAATLLRADVLECLKREFRDLVRCVSYGAAIARDAFESVVGRVIGEVVVTEEE